MINFIIFIIALVVAIKWHKDGVEYTDEEIMQCNINNE